jgi:hypothetical protein
MSTPVTPPPPTPTQPYKAIVAGVLSFLAALYFELQGRETIEGMSASEWFMVILAAVVVSGATWFVPNPAKAVRRR